MRRRRPEPKAYALLVALVVVALLLIGGALLTQELVNGSNLLRAETNELHLQAALDSGVAYMMATYQINPYFSGTVDLKVGKSQAFVEAELAGGSLRKLKVEGTYAGMHRRVEVTLSVIPGNPVQMIDWKPVMGPATR